METVASLCLFFSSASPTSPACHIVAAYLYPGREDDDIMENDNKIQSSAAGERLATN